MDTNLKIFVLGDSRTGTSTLAAFLKALNFNSIHYYREDSNQISPDNENRETNWINLRDFINTNNYQAFSDYPTRLYYQELAKEYPNAKFILTVRKNIDIWKKSMIKYFSKFDIKLNIEHLEKIHNSINNDIKFYFSKNPENFIEICIDDDSSVNSKIIKDFLSIDSHIEMGWENKSEDVDIEVPRYEKLYIRTLKVLMP